MYQVERLCVSDYDELLAFLNRVFGYRSDNGFDCVLPCMWRRDDTHMRKHLAIRDGVGGDIIAALGVYPLTVHIGDKTLCIATCGNVGTEAAYRGRGCMRTLMEAAMAELDEIGADAARLGGQRQRYARYGFAPVGTLHTFDLTQKNIAGREDPGISFRPILRGDTAALSFVRTLQQGKPFYVDRVDDASLYDVLCAWYHTPYLALDRDGRMLGVLSASSDKTKIAEQYAPDAKTEYDMLCAWLVRNGIWSLSCHAYPWDAASIRLLGSTAEHHTVSHATQCRVLHWDALITALLGLRGAETVQTGEFVLEITGYGGLCFTGGSCVRCDDRTPDLTLDALTAARLLFGYETPAEVCETDILPPQKAMWLRSVLPLPFGWCGQDRV